MLNDSWCVRFSKGSNEIYFPALWGLTFCGGKKSVSNVFIFNLMKPKKLTKGIWLEIKQE